MIVDQKEFIRRGARNFGNKKAFVYKGGKPSLVEGISLTFKEVDERANRVANGLRALGYGPGTRVATLAHNCLEYGEIEFGLMKGAYPQTVLNPMLSASELQFQIDNSEFSIMGVQHSYAETIDSMRSSPIGRETLFPLMERTRRNQVLSWVWIAWEILATLE